MDRPPDFATWTTPECPFLIQYSLGVLEEIRLAVMDAFFSLPRGGVEIGGVLTGIHEKNGIQITGYLPLDCEHAYGPSFTLSDRDYAKLEELLSTARRGGRSQVPVGWYHSHTRSEVFFSDADIAIHKRFFPEPWQVALVLKPHTFQPMRAGFFFREAGGNIHGVSSYREFTLEPQWIRAGAETPPAPLSEADRPVPPAPEPDAPARVEVEPPEFLTAAHPPSRRWPWVLTALVAAAAGGAYQSRRAWVPRVQAALLHAPAAPAAAPTEMLPIPLGLTTADENGQLHIVWDRNSPAIRQSKLGILSISEGTVPLVITLDQAHLQAGSFTYGRQSNRVDVGLTIQAANGRNIREVSTYVGALPEKTLQDPDQSLQKERDALAKETESLKADLKKQAERTRRLENSVDQMRLELIRQQRIRLQNMNPDAPHPPNN